MIGSPVRLGGSFDGAMRGLRSQSGITFRTVVTIEWW